MSLLSSHPEVDLVGPAGGSSLWIFGVLVTIKALAKDTGGAYSVLEGMVPPGVGPPTHIHAQDEESWYVLEGELTFKVGKKTFHATEGSFLRLPRNVPHSFSNESDKPARLLFSFVPGGFDEWFAQVGTPVADYYAPGDPPPMTEDSVNKALTLAAEKYGITFVDGNESKDEL